MKTFFWQLIFLFLLIGTTQSQASQTKQVDKIKLVYPDGLMEELRARIGEERPTNFLDIGTLGMPEEEKEALLNQERDFLNYSILAPNGLPNLDQLSPQYIERHQGMFQQILAGMQEVIRPRAGNIFVNASIFLGEGAGVRIAQFLLHGMISHEGMAWNQIRGLSRALVYFTARQSVKMVTSIDVRGKKFQETTEALQFAARVSLGDELVDSLEERLHKVEKAFIDQVASGMGLCVYNTCSWGSGKLGASLGQVIGETIAKYYGFELNYFDDNGKVIESASWAIRASDYLNGADHFEIYATTAWVLVTDSQDQEEIQMVSNLVWGGRKLVSWGVWGCDKIGQAASYLYNKVRSKSYNEIGQDLGYQLIILIDNKAYGLGWRNSTWSSEHLPLFRKGLSFTQAPAKLLLNKIFF